MEKHQEYAYKEAIEEYRAVSHARITKVSDGDPNTIAGVLPRRQISNYFVQFRKVLPFLLIFFCQFILFLWYHSNRSYFPCLFQIANHPLLVRRIYSDEDVIRFAKKLHPMGAFGFECTLERVIEELKSYNDFSIHRVISLSLRGPVRYTKSSLFLISCHCMWTSEFPISLHVKEI